MAKQYKKSYRFYSAWNYEGEIEALNKASEQGWQLVRGGCFHSRFVKNYDVRYRYQLDFQKPDDLARYIETFREQGWEYVNSTFNGWNYFRKAYDPALPEEEYEIFTDRESIKEMNTRWARIALGIGVALLLFTLLYLVRMIINPTLPTLILVLLFGIESGVLLWGASTMRNPEGKRNWKWDQAFMGIFLTVLLVGAVSSITLMSLRPDFWSEQQTESMEIAKVDEEWNSFKVRYKDNYFVDLKIEASKPATVKIVDQAGNVVFQETATGFNKKNIRLKLDPGMYKGLLSAESGFKTRFEID